jgi:hypothetical protein
MSKSKQSVDPIINQLESNFVIPKEPCKTHKAPKLPYLAWHAYAEERYKKGDKQTRCSICGRWYFKDEL